MPAATGVKEYLGSDGLQHAPCGKGPAPHPTPPTPGSARKGCATPQPQRPIQPSSAGKNRQKKRFWADEEKRSICEQAITPGVSVAQVARRYSMNANLIFKWLKDPRFSPATVETSDAPEAGCVFLPVEISGSTAEHQV
ncbi:MAG: transposase, partial [Paracoccaceae bacterium]